MKHHTIKIEDELCWGCKTCEVACKQEFHTPFGVKLITVSEEGPKESNGKLEFVYHVNLCRHCDDPPCAEACPEEIIFKREDGIVLLDSDKCTGCQSCIDECPYGAIVFDDENGIARKCNLCHQRVDNGLIPACADNICLAHCIHFGDLQKK